MPIPRRPLARFALLAALPLAAAPGCGGGSGAGPDAGVDAAADAAIDPLASLAGTGLCVDRACARIAPEVREYAPQYALWDDGAAKRRWIYLPPGSQIDTSDMSRWKFPVGTKVWKEFTRDGVRVETRLVQKALADDAAPGAWIYATYVWTPAQDDALAVTTGVENALGTQHDVPTRAQCRECHDRLEPTRVLGFEAIQLDALAAPGLVDLADLVAEGRLTAPPQGTAPYFRIPGGPVDRAALGYLHANCGHCHNPSSDVFDKTPVDLRLRTDRLTAVTATPAYTTAVNVSAAIPYTESGVTYTKIIVPDDPAASALLARMNSSIPLRFMPNVSVEDVDPAGQAALTAWINAL